MKCKRLLTLCLTLTMLLSTLPFAAAAEGDDWLIPRMRGLCRHDPDRRPPAAVTGASF